MTPQPRTELQRLEAAEQMVADLCTGKERWTMRVPVEEERDSDTVIMAALHDLRVRIEAEAAAPAVESLTVERPEIVVLCGSTRFYDMFQAANYDLTMLGKIVLSVGFYPHSQAIHGHGEGVGHDSAEKVALDELHKRKIDLADRVYVLNVDGYIGESTRSEINYAIAHGKPVDYLEPGSVAALATPEGTEPK